MKVAMLPIESLEQFVVGASTYRPPDGYEVPDDFVYFVGDGDVDLACSRCDRVLVRGAAVAAPVELRGSAMLCPWCSTMNVIRK